MQKYLSHKWVQQIFKTKVFGSRTIEFSSQGRAKRTESKTPKYLSKNSNIRKMLKSYPLNILKVQSRSSKVSNLGQIFIFTENCTPNNPYESFHFLLLSKSIFLKNPKILFPAKIPDPKPSSQLPRIFNYRVPPGRGLAEALISVKHSNDTNKKGFLL